MLSITLTNERVDTIVKVNGQRVKFKKIIVNKKAYRRGVVKAEGDIVLTAYNYYDLQHHGFLYGVLLWFLGFFGLFFKKFDYTFNLEAEVKFRVEGDMSIEIEFYPYLNKTEQAAALCIKDMDKAYIVKNRYYFDQSLQKRTKRYNRLYRLMTFLSIVGTAVLLTSLI